MEALIDSRYRSLRLLGQGGAGQVFLVEDTFQENQRLALKMLEPGADESRRELLAREFFHLSKLHHPNLIQVYDFGVELDSGRSYFTMELVDGPDLLTATESLALAETYPLVAQLCRALGYLHDSGFLHNDVKPGNILVTGEGPERRIRLLDFGLASARMQGEAWSRSVQGTLSYLAPELLAGRQPDVRSELYALGVVLFEIFTRALPEPGLQPPPRASSLAPQLPPQLDGLLGDLLAQQPRERPASAQEVLSRLSGATGIHFESETPETIASYVRMGRLAQRHQILAVVDGVVRCIGGPGLAESSSSGSEPPPSAEATAAAPGILLLTGEHGSGRSRILKEIRVRAQLSGLLTLQVQGASGQTRQYGIIRQLLERLLPPVPEARLRQLLQQCGGGVLKILPGLCLDSELPQSFALPPPQEEERLHEQISSFLLALISSPRPALILIDDLDFVDERSLKLFQHLARNLWGRRQGGEPFSVAIVATGLAQQARGSGRDKLQSMRVEPFCWELPLEPLSRDAVHEVVAAMFCLESVSDRFRDWVFAVSEGNPLFVVELLEFLVDDGHICREDGLWTIRIEEPMGLQIPKSLSDILSKRLGRLEPEALRVLQVLAALGRPILEPQLLQLLKLKPSKASRVLQGMVRRQLLEERRQGDRVFLELEQPVTGEVIYRQMQPEARRALHLEIARLLEAFGSEQAEELARHYLLGGEPLSACRPAWRAGDALRQIYSNAKALEMYQIVLDAFAEFRAKNDWARFPLQIGELVEVYWASLKLHQELGQYREALECGAALLYLAERTGNARLKAQATKQLGSLYRWRSDYERSRICVQRALESFRRLDDLRGMADSLHEMGYLHYLMGQYLTSLEFYQQSLGIRRSLEDRGGVAESYNNIGTVHFYLGNYPQSMDYYRKALEIRRSIDDQYGIGKNLNNIGLIHYQLGDLERARKYLEESLELKRGMGERSGVANTLSNLGEIHRTLGQYAKSFECESESLKLKRQIGDQQGCCISGSNLGITCTRLGRYDEALEHLSTALATTRRIGFRVLETEVLCNLAETHFELGNTRQALQVAEQALRLANENASRPDQMTANLTLGSLYLELQKPEDAVGCLHLALQLATELSNKEKLAAAQIFLGVHHRLAGRLAEAMGVLEKGLRLARDLKSLYWVARAHLEQGWVHLERRENEAAAEVLRLARSSATRLECPELEWQLCFVAGLAESGARRYMAAFEHYRKAVEVFRDVTRQLAAEPLREAYLGDRRRSRVGDCIRDLKSELRRLAP